MWLHCRLMSTLILSSQRIQEKDLQVFWSEIRRTPVWTHSLTLHHASRQEIERLCGFPHKQDSRAPMLNELMASTCLNWIPLLFGAPSCHVCGTGWV